jgi:type IV pilus assembly protein PilZ
MTNPSHTGVTAHGGEATFHDVRDRRHQDRVPLEIKVRYPRRNAFFFEYTRNISRGGMFIGTQRPFPIGTRFDFALEIPGEPEPMILHGEVRWRVTEDDLQGLHQDIDKLETGMGIAFLFADDDERRRFERHVEEMLDDAFGPELAAALFQKR